MTGPKEYTVTLRRSRGRFVKQKTVPSKYAAKKLRQLWEDKYDHTYTVETTTTSES